MNGLRKTTDLPGLLLDPGPHKALDKLPLKKQKCDQQRTRCHQSRGVYNRPLNPAVDRGKYTKPDCHRTSINRVGHDERPQEVIPVMAD